MPNSYLQSGQDKVYIDIISSENTSLEINVVTLPVIGGKPVIRPTAHLGETISFKVVLYASTYEELKDKKKALKDFVANHCYEYVTFYCQPDEDYSGTYQIVSLTGGVESNVYCVAEYTLTMKRIS